MLIFALFQIDHQLCNNPGSNLPVNLQTAGHLDHTGMPTAPSLVYNNPGYNFPISSQSPWYSHPSRTGPSPDYPMYNNPDFNSSMSSQTAAPSRVHTGPIPGKQCFTPINFGFGLLLYDDAKIINSNSIYKRVLLN